MFAAGYFVHDVIQAYQLNFFKPHMDAEGIDADRITIVVPGANCSWRSSTPSLTGVLSR